MSEMIRMAHGGGGTATAELIRRVFRPYFNHPELQKANDAATVNVEGGRIAVTTDGFVVTPWRFPGGDIGKLSICGTVNDLTMMGAEPLALTAGFIIEEGFSINDLAEIAGSMAETAKTAGVSLVAGDTKVVEKGAADGIFITTSGVGVIPPRIFVGGEKAQPGDRIITSGTLGDHGATILMARGELGLSGDLQSDVAPLNNMLQPLIGHCGEGIHVMRDPTRGGLAATLNEIAGQAGVAMRLNQKNIPIRPAVYGLCDLLGLDPLYLANEGKVIIIAKPEVSEDILARLRRHSLGRDAAIIGEVYQGRPGMVSICMEEGGERILPLGSGEQLPRIC